MTWNVTQECVAEASQSGASNSEGEGFTRLQHHVTGYLV